MEREILEQLKAQTALLTEIRDLLAAQQTKKNRVSKIEKNGKPPAYEIPTTTSEARSAAITAWMDHKAGQYKTPQLAVQRLITVADEYCDETVSEAVQRAIGAGWKGWEHDLDRIAERIRHRNAKESRIDAQRERTAAAAEYLVERQMRLTMPPGDTRSSREMMADFEERLGK